jgi:2-polyprenyl-3-methyl-5-hydroxy-6-metoxy-1,4-benzoquinol methylase/glycosyltransferase involved in cell wall biosynthesis
MTPANAAVTRIGNFRTFPISRDVNGSANDTDAKVLKLVGKNKRVLELGCGCGHMSRALSEQGCHVVGIEIHPQAAQTASAACERVIVGDLDYLNFDKELGSDRFDVVLAADVLEHLKDPLFVLQAIKQFLLPHGYIVVSVPNVAHISIRLALLAGKFPYSPMGLLDQTHLRFLTRESLETLIESAQFAIGHFERITSVPDDPAHFEVPFDPAVLPAELFQEISNDPEARTYQFVLSGYPLPEAGLDFVQSRIKTLAQQMDVLRGELVAARKEAVALRDTVLSRDERCNQLVSEKSEAEGRAAAAFEETQFLNAEIARLQNILGKAEGTSELLAEDIRARDVRINDHSRTIAGLKSQVETLLTREKDLREMLLDAHEQLLRRDDEIASTLASVLPQTSTASNALLPAGQAAGKYVQYQQMVQKIRQLVSSHVPNGGRVLVVSKGDDDLLRIDPCQGTHFPQREDGKYAGYYPADGASALAHLKDLQQKGAQFLLIPQTARWWLDHYRELADYLNGHCTRVINDHDVCIMFDLAPPKPTPNRNHEDVCRNVEGRSFGVNLCGNINSEKGVGEAVRSQARSFLAAGVPIVLNDYLDDSACNIVHEFTDVVRDNPYAVNLVHLNADTLPDFIESREKEFFADHYNIGFWAWETPTFPHEWWDRFQYLDEIWVGSNFVLDAISRVSPIPVIKTPLAVPIRSSVTPYQRPHFGLSPKTFVFLFAFDYMSVAERKNPLGLVQAFRKAFSMREDVTLVLKAGHSEAHPFEATLLKQACAGANIRIIEPVLSREELNSLMHIADCYVSLHRSEGFGLTIAEAMSLGKPVIATGYSGNLEFMTPANSFLVKYDLHEIDKPYGPYREGCWAEPNLNHAAELMRFVFKNPVEAKEIGRRARADIAQHLSPNAIGRLMRNRLLRIADSGRIPCPDIDPADTEPIKPKNNGFYRNLVARIRQIVETNTPTEARVIVISKGDEDLVGFSGRDGWHFPQNSDGRYAGYYPGSDLEVIGHLETLSTNGGEYFLIPQTAFWWLDHYPQLRSHLDKRYRRVWSDSDCVIYRLVEKSHGAVSRLREKIAVFRKR